MWNAHVRDILQQREPSLIDLLNWLERLVDAEYNPYAISIGSKASSRQDGQHSTSRLSNRGKKMTFKTSSGIGNPQATVSKGDKKSVKKCPKCSKDHTLYRCTEFKDMTVEARRQFVQNHRLCFNCLHSGHIATKCQSSGRCQEKDCHKNHHTLLHIMSVPMDVNTSDKDSTEVKVVGVNATGRRSGDEGVFLQIIPVVAYGMNGHAVQTFALLDSASEVSLVENNLAIDLGLKGKKKTLKMKTLNSETVHDSRVVSFTVKGINDSDSEKIHINNAWTVSAGTFGGVSQTVQADMKHIKDLNIESVVPGQVQILIGISTPEAHLQEDIRRGSKEQPIAVRTPLGWSLIGGKLYDQVEAKVNFTFACNDLLGRQVEQFWKTESLGIVYTDKTSLSIEDRRAMSIPDSTTVLQNGHYEVGLLWRNSDTVLPNNVHTAQRRYDSVAKRLCNKSDFATTYVKTVNDYIAKGYAQKLNREEIQRTTKHTWYLPHHGVTNSNKPGKVRVVFDAAAVHMKTSLNENLLTGPDLLNSLFGVLQRFRFHPVALVADVEAMFHQVKVPDIDCDVLRFLWKEDVHMPGPPDEYKMMVHIFGAKDSPCCANYALRRTAKDNIHTFSSAAVNTVLRDFYVDDLVKSVGDEKQAVSLAEELTQLLKTGGFHLHKWLSNSPEVLNSISKSERAVDALDLDLDELPVQRALGLRWDVREDSFIFSPRVREVPETKRGVVSFVSSIFDPCGFIAPYTLRGKCLIQELWRQNVDWDESLPQDLVPRWMSFVEEVDDLSNFCLPRYLKGFSPATKLVELHIFSDASEVAFGAVAYIRYQLKEDGTTAFLASKTHVAPIKRALSIPRLELQGALLAVRLYNALKKEIDVPVSRTMFWTDSTTVLCYLKNETRRFKPFVSNRISEILDSSTPDQWHHVSSEDNPADHCTRGLKARELTPDHIWFTGPKFLCLEEDQWPKQGSEIPLLPPENDPELKSSKFIMTTFDREDGPFDKLTIGKEIHISKHSTWRKLTRHTAWVMRSIRSFMSALPRSTMQAFKTRYLQPEEYQEATECLLQQAHYDVFADEIKQLKDGKHINVKSSLLPLMPFFDGRHLRVGGRIHKAQVPLEAKHQLILPEKHHVTKLLVEEFHMSNGHCGREHLISLLRQKYWPINARKVSSQVISSCLYCRRQRVRPTAPVMAALPECRVSAVAGPFHVTGVDYFGPMMVKVQRSTVKRWGCLFTCMSTRAIHLELADSLDTDYFIMALRNFIGRRGQPAEMYSDNGTNFVGAYHELKQCLAELNQDAVQRYLAPQGIKWNFNPPSAPHFGGAWERLVRSDKLALKTIIKGVSVKESALIEVEAMLNSRPLTHNSADVTDFDALTPNHFLLGRANAAFSPVKVEDREINSRKRWKQVQVIANHVHKRWLKEYLPSLTVRHKWLTTGQMVQEGDLVLLINDNAPRGQWELGRVIDTYPGEDLCVRAVKIKTAKGEYVRPVSKVCILEENVKDNV